MYNYILWQLPPVFAKSTRQKHRFTPAPGVEMTAEEQETYVAATKKRVGYLLDSTPMIIENDFYSLLPQYTEFGQSAQGKD